MGASEKSREELEEKIASLTKNLYETREQFIRFEKMAILGELTTGIAHEINNSINFIGSGSVSLEKDFQDLLKLFKLYREQAYKNGGSSEITELEKDLDIDFLIATIPQTIADIKEGAEKVIQIAKGLKLFSRIDSEVKKRADVHQGLDLTLVLLKNKLGDKIQSNKDYGSDVDQIPCYSRLLNQVFMNLMANAIEAMDEGGVLSVTTRNYPDKITISIKDSGVGIPLDIIGCIFESFFTTKDEGKGSGLGLSISKDIIDKHNGKIEVYSEQGIGSEFVITLPKG